MLAFEESGKKSPSESRFECKKKILERTDKERFLSTKREVSDLDEMFPKIDDALLVFTLLMKREPRRAKK